MKNKATIFEAFKNTLPVTAGYIILGIGFGVIMSANGWSILYSVAMSVFIYAGSMQYAAIGLFTGGASFLTVALTTLAVNARHLFYGISMLGKYKSAGIKKTYLIFALTDETYSLVCSTDKGTDYCFLVSVFDHIYWITGTFLGALLGSAVSFNSKGIDFALTALFVTVFVDQWLKSKNHFSAVTGVLCTAAMLVLFGAESFLIPSMLAITVILLAVPERRLNNDR